MSKSKCLWFVNLTEIEGAGRTTRTVVETTLKRARAHAACPGQYGYIVKQSEHGSRVFCYFGGFSPDETERLYIDALLDTDTVMHPSAIAAKMIEMEGSRA